jgi:predicted nucleic acid-binding protein
LILYLDTSALVKRYVAEIGTDRVLRDMNRAKGCATSLLTYAEMRSALSRLTRRGLQSRDVVENVTTEFEDGWRDLTHVAPDPQLVSRAGSLAAEIDLRAYDAVHLASAERIRNATVGARVVFACFDASLNRAAHLLGFEVLSET